MSDHAALIEEARRYHTEAGIFLARYGLGLIARITDALEAAEANRETLADAWDKGFDVGANTSIGIDANPYRKEED